MDRIWVDLGSALVKALLSNLPEGGRVIQVLDLESSDWSDTTRYDGELPTGETTRFFKRAYGSGGAELTAAHWNSESSICKFIPEFVPRPIATGTYKSNTEAHFFPMDFADMVDDVISDPEAYRAAPAALQLRSLRKSPTGSFGFLVVTRFANLKQKIDWELSWEAWGIKHTEFILERKK